MAPPMLPQVFITADTDPAKSPPMSSGSAQETPIVNSSAKRAAHVYQTHAYESVVIAAGRMKAPAIRNPIIATPRRAATILPVLLYHSSDNHPPARSPSVPARSGKLAKRPICVRLNPRCSRRYVGNQVRYTLKQYP